MLTQNIKRLSKKSNRLFSLVYVDSLCQNCHPNLPLNPNQELIDYWNSRFFSIWTVFSTVLMD